MGMIRLSSICFCLGLATHISGTTFQPRRRLSSIEDEKRMSEFFAVIERAAGKDAWDKYDVNRKDVDYSTDLYPNEVRNIIESMGSMQSSEVGFEFSNTTNNSTNTIGDNSTDDMGDDSPDDDDSGRPGLLILILSGFFVAIASVVAFVLGGLFFWIRRNRDEDDEPTPFCEQADLSSCQQEVCSFALFNGNEFSNAGSYQRKALDWLCPEMAMPRLDGNVIQKYALTALYFATFNVTTRYTTELLGDRILPWNVVDGWLDSSVDECSWALVTCQNRSVRGNYVDVVTELNLALNFLTGELPPEVSLLSHLETLDIGLNPIFARSEVINSYLAEITTLKELRYDDTNFISETGIPTEFTSLTELEYFDCSHVLYKGAIQGSSFSAAQGALTTLHAMSNEFGSSIPTEIALLPSLQDFDASENLHTGDLTFLENMPSIVYLRLADNNFGSPLPGFLGNKTTLFTLNLRKGNWMGTLPTEIALLTTLAELHVGENSLSGVVPEAFGVLSNLQVLNLQDNQFTGTLSEGICQINTIYGADLFADCEICPRSSCCDNCS